MSTLLPFYLEGKAFFVGQIEKTCENGGKLSSKKEKKLSPQDKRAKVYSLWGSNPRPSACEADVIAARPNEQSVIRLKFFYQI